MVNGFLKATQINKNLADKTKLFLPYVEMYDTGDKIKFMVDWGSVMIYDELISIKVLENW